MGVSSYWMAFMIDEDQYEKVLPAFKAAERKAILNEKQLQAIEFWRNYEGPIDWMEGDTSMLMNEFICAFNLPAFEELGEEFISTDGKYDFGTEENCFRFIITNRNTPVSLLWQALGYEKAASLPGKMGNLIVHPNETAATLKLVEEIYKGESEEDMVYRAKFISWNEVREDELHGIVSMIPAGLKKANELNKGIVFLARIQL